MGGREDSQIWVVAYYSYFAMFSDTGVPSKVSGGRFSGKSWVLLRLGAFVREGSSQYEVADMHPLSSEEGEDVQKRLKPSGCSNGTPIYES